MLDLWLRILDIMDRLVNSGQGDSLVSEARFGLPYIWIFLTVAKEEAVPESLKNVLLVMANGGFLVSPSENPDHATLWQETRKRLERFLPGMFAELFPEPRPKSPTSSPVSVVNPG